MQNETITTVQVKRLQSLWRAAGVPEDAYRAMVASSTGGRSSSTKDLTASAAAGLIMALQRMTKTETPDEESANRMRRKLIALAYQLHPAMAKPEAVKWLNKWCQQYGYAHKPLNSYSCNELPKLIGQLEAAYKWYLDKI